MKPDSNRTYGIALLMLVVAAWITWPRGTSPIEAKAEVASVPARLAVERANVPARSREHARPAATRPDDGPGAPLAMREGRVVDPNGATVAGAEVLRLDDWGFVPTRAGDAVRVPRLDGAIAVATTASDGSFALGEATTSELLLAVSARGLGWTTLAAHAHRTELTIALQPCGCLEVEAVDPDGAPRAHAVVTCEPRFAPLSADTDRDVCFAGPLAAPFVACTDSAGIARFQALPCPPGGARYDLRVRDGEQVVRRSGVAIDAGSPARVRVTLPYDAHVTASGTVRDVRGEAVAGARVVIRSGNTRQTTADAAGRFVIDGLRRGRGALDVRVDAPGFAPLAAERDAPDASRTVDLELVLAPAVPLFGQVRDRAGRPVAGAAVLCRAADEPPRLSRTDADGRFRFDDVADRRRHDLRVVGGAPGRTARPLEHVAAPADSPVALVLDREPPGHAALRAEILDAGGAPLEPGEVRLRRAAGEAPVPVRLQTGVVTAGGLGDGRWTLSVEPQFGPSIERTFTVSPEHDVLRLRLVQSVGTVIEGEVVVPPEHAPGPDRLRLVIRGTNVGHFEAAANVASLGHVATIDLTSSPRFRIADVDPSRPVVIAIDDRTWTGRVTVQPVAARTASCRVPIERAAYLHVTSAVPWPTDAFLLRWLSDGDGEPPEPMPVAGALDRTSLLIAALPPGSWRWRITVPTSGSTNGGGTRELRGVVHASPGGTCRIVLDPRDPDAR